MAFVFFWNAKDAIAALDEVILFKGGRQLKISIPFDKNTKRPTVTSYTRGNKPTKQYPKNYTKNHNEPRYNRDKQLRARPKPSKV
jgi:hypothetical protein